MRRFLMALATYLMAGVLGGLLVRLGYLDSDLFLGLFVFGCAINLVFYVLLRSGVSRFLEDPSLTAAQIVVATVMLMVLLYAVGAARGVLLMFYPVCFVFGVFRLSTRQFLVLNVFALASYGGLIALLQWTRPERIDLDLELLQWLALAFVLPSFALIGGYISRMRNELGERNEELNEALRRISEMAIRDELTGAYNRRYIMDLLAHEQARAERSGEPFAVALVDLDHFKGINDRYGHVAGDKVLQAFVDTCMARLRVVDCLARYGGEEFLLLMPRTHLPEAELIAERIRKAVEYLRLDEIDPDLRLSISVGVAVARRGERPVRLIERADAALYRAKSSGRNRVMAHRGSAQD
mgnify:CR=1 FL=1